MKNKVSSEVILKPLSEASNVDPCPHNWMLDWGAHAKIQIMEKINHEDFRLRKPYKEKSK